MKENRPPTWFWYWPHLSAAGYRFYGGGHTFLNLLLLVYSPGGTAKPHTDHFRGKTHVRANLRLWGENTFKTTGRIYFKLGPLVVFDAGAEHWTEPSKRWRLVLSFGVAL